MAKIKNLFWKLFQWVALILSIIAIAIILIFSFTIPFFDHVMIAVVLPLLAIAACIFEYIEKKKIKKTTGDESIRPWLLEHTLIVCGALGIATGVIVAVAYGSPISDIVYLIGILGIIILGLFFGVLEEMKTDGGGESLKSLQENNGVEESSNPLQENDGGGESFKLLQKNNQLPGCVWFGLGIAAIVPVIAIVLILIALFSASGSGDLYGIN